MKDWQMVTGSYTNNKYNFIYCQLQKVLLKKFLPEDW